MAQLWEDRPAAIREESGLLRGFSALDLGRARLISQHWKSLDCRSRR
jgi:hypothetical protein